MPKGVYARKPKTAGSPPGTEAPKLGEKKRKKAAKTNGRAMRAELTRRDRGESARFGVFSDGSVQVDAASCKGILQPDEAKTLVAFIQRLGVK